MKSNLIAALVLIVIGAILLLNNLGYADVSLARLFTTWWPAILIAVGVGLLFKRSR
jgi:hypothetical protein